MFENMVKFSGKRNGRFIYTGSSRPSIFSISKFLDVSKDITTFSQDYPGNVFLLQACHRFQNWSLTCINITTKIILNALLESKLGPLIERIHSHFTAIYAELLQLSVSALQAVQVYWIENLHSFSALNTMKEYFDFGTSTVDSKLLLALLRLH